MLFQQILSLLQKIYHKFFMETNFMTVFLCDKEVCVPLIPSQENEFQRSLEFMTAMIYTSAC